MDGFSQRMNSPVDVRFTTSGVPLAVRHEGRIWVVAAESFHWFGRQDWWGTGGSAAKGSGDVVSIEYWRVQVRLSPTSALRSFTLRRDAPSSAWFLDSIQDHTTAA